MSTKLKALMGAAMVFAFSQALCGQPLVVQPAAENDPVRDEFVTAMQRIRLHQPDLPDSAALEQYAIHDYLVAARLRRDLAAGVDDNLPVVQAQAVLAQAQSQLVNTLYQYNQSKLTLARNTGVVETQYKAYLGR